MPDSGGGWVAEHWDSAIAGVAALGMLARELWRMRDERAKRLREDAKEHRDEGEGIFQRALTLLRETEDRYRRSEGQLEAARADRDKFEALAEQLAARIARYGIGALAEELSEPDPSMRAVLDSMPVAFAVTRADSGRFVIANARFCAILGRTSAEVLAGSWQDWIAPEDRDRTAGVESLALDRPVEIENDYLRPDGSRIRLHWTASRYRQVSVAWCEEVEGLIRSAPHGPPRPVRELLDLPAPAELAEQIGGGDSARGRPAARRSPAVKVRP